MNHLYDFTPTGSDRYGNKKCANFKTDVHKTMIRVQSIRRLGKQKAFSRNIFTVVEIKNALNSCKECHFREQKKIADL